MVTFTINIPQMLAYIAYMDPMGYVVLEECGLHLPIAQHLTGAVTQPEQPQIYSRHLTLHALEYLQSSLLIVLVNACQYVSCSKL